MSADNDRTDVDAVVAVQRRAEDVADRVEQGDADVEDAADAIRDLATLVGDLSDDIRALKDWKEEYGPWVEHTQKRQFGRDIHELELRVDELEEERGMAPHQQPTTIQQFAAMPPDARESLGPSDRRAAFLFENFSDWAKKTQNGYVLSTTTERDGRARLKQLLEQALKEHGYDRDGLQWTEVYRAMKMVARKSGGEDDQIDDGAFRYIESWNDPWTPNEETCKVLVLERPELLEQD